MRTLISLHLDVQDDDGVLSLYAANAGCGCCCITAPVFGDEVVAEEPIVASGEHAGMLLAELCRRLATQALAAMHNQDPVDLIREVRDRLRAWGETARSLWLRSPDSEDHLRNQASNLLALAEKLDLAIAEIQKVMP